MKFSFPDSNCLQSDAQPTLITYVHCDHINVPPGHGDQASTDFHAVTQSKFRWTDIHSGPRTEKSSCIFCIRYAIPQRTKLLSDTPVYSTREQRWESSLGNQDIPPEECPYGACSRSHGLSDCRHRRAVWRLINNHQSFFKGNRFKVLKKTLTAK